MKLFKKVEKVPLYPYHFCVLISSDYKDMNDFLHTQGMPFDVDVSKHICCAITDGTIKIEEDKFFCVYVCFNPFAEELNHGLIAHEIHHAVNGIMHGFGHALDAVNDETQAYFTQWLTDFTYSAFDDCGALDKIKLKK